MSHLACMSLHLQLSQFLPQLIQTLHLVSNSFARRTFKALLHIHKFFTHIELKVETGFEAVKQSNASATSKFFGD